MDEIDKNLQRQRGYFDSNFLVAEEIDRLRAFGKVIPGFDIMRGLTTACELRIKLQRAKREAKRQSATLASIASITPTRNISSAIKIAREAIGQ